MTWKTFAALMAMAALGWWSGWSSRGAWDKNRNHATVDPGDITLTCWLDRNGFRVCGDLNNQQPR